MVCRIMHKTWKKKELTTDYTLTTEDRRKELSILILFQLYTKFHAPGHRTHDWTNSNEENLHLGYAQQ